MKQVKIKQIELHYFKGQKRYWMDFSNDQQEILGKNGSGKSTMVDAFHWCLWGKNAAGQSDQKFNIKTLDENGVEIPHVNHEVELVLDVDGQNQTFKRVLVPEYTKDDILKGNHTEYYWNNVPMKKSEYDQKVCEVVKEDVFKLITSPYAFLQLDWQKQREILMRMAGDIKDEDVEGEEYTALKTILQSKTLEEHNKEVAARIKKVNEAMQNIPARIDEVQRGIPELDDPEMLEEMQKQTEADIESLDRAMQSAILSVQALNAGRNELTKQIADLKYRQNELLQNAQAKERNEINESNATFKEAELRRGVLKQELENDSTSTRNQLALLELQIQNLTRNREKLEKEVQELRTKWTMTSTRVFKADEFLKCPLYGHLCQDGTACSKYDDDQGGAFDKWQEQKEADLAEINQRGQALKKQLEESRKTIEESERSITTLKEGYTARSKDYESRVLEIDRIQAEHPRRPLIATIQGTDIPEWVELGLQITELQTKLQNTAEYEVENDKQSKERRAELSMRLDYIKQRKNEHKIAEAAHKRIEQLLTEQRDLGNQKMELEMQRDTARAFEVAKMNIITDKINSMFKLVKWQMFQRQVNGEEVPACICTYNGVPWNDVNEAARLDAGIDVAYTLSKASNVAAPIFIDGAEKSLNIYYQGGQMILLRVADTDKLQKSTIG